MTASSIRAPAQQFAAAVPSASRAVRAVQVDVVDHAAGIGNAGQLHEAVCGRGVIVHRQPGSDRGHQFTTRFVSLGPATPIVRHVPPELRDRCLCLVHRNPQLGCNSGRTDHPRRQVATLVGLGDGHLQQRLGGVDSMFDPSWLI